MSEKKRKFMVRLICLILAGLMVIGGGIAAISVLLGG